MRVVRGVGHVSVLGGRFRRARGGAKVSILLRAITPRRVPASPASRTSNVTSAVANALLANPEARSSRGGRQPPVLRTGRGRRRPPGKRRAIPDRGRASRHDRDRSGCRLCQRPERPIPGRRFHRTADRHRGFRLPRHPWTSRGACRRQSLRHKLRQAPRRTFRLRPRRQSPRPWRPWSQRARYRDSPARPRDDADANQIGLTRNAGGYCPRSASRPATPWARAPRPRFRRCEVKTIPDELSYHRQLRPGRSPAPTPSGCLSATFKNRPLAWSKKTRGWLPRSVNWGGCKTASTIRSQTRFRACSTSRSRVARVVSSLLSLGWVQDGISADEAEAIDWINNMSRC